MTVEYQSDAHRAAHSVLDVDASEVLLGMIASAEQDGYRWVYDPEVDAVVGLCRPGSNYACCVVYIDEGDWEGDL